MFFDPIAIIYQKKRVIFQIRISLHLKLYDEEGQKNVQCQCAYFQIIRLGKKAKRKMERMEDGGRKRERQKQVVRETDIESYREKLRIVQKERERERGKIDGRRFFPAN